MLVVLLLAATTFAYAQDRSNCLGTGVRINYDSPLTYDVVRIRQHNDDLYQAQNLPNGLSFHGITLANLIAGAFGVRSDQVVGGPEG